MLRSIEKRLMEIQGQRVLLDGDVTTVYGVATKRINEAVRNNPAKFPPGYVVARTPKEWKNLRSKNSTANFNMSRVTPKAFTEKGLYMLATILKGEKATRTSLLIIETFAKLRSLQQTVALATTKTDKEKTNLLKKSSELMADLLDTDFSHTESETTVEINFALLKLKHTTKRKKEPPVQSKKK